MAKTLKKLYHDLKSAVKAAVAGGLAALTLGCASMTSENGILTIAASPFSESQWKNHRCRTAAVAGCYVSGIYYATRGRDHKSRELPVQEQYQEFQKYKESSGINPPVAPPVDIYEPDGNPVSGGSTYSGPVGR